MNAVQLYEKERRKRPDFVGMGVMHLNLLKSEKLSAKKLAKYELLQIVFVK